MSYKLTKELRRTYELLNLMIDADRPLSKHEVSIRIGCSRPTLDRTISDANQLISEFTSVEFTTEGLFLQKKGQLNKHQIRSLISNQTFIVQFLSDLLLGNVTTLEEWAESHFYSVSVAYRQTREITDYLKVFDIQLVNENNYWYLSGDSWRVRFFYFQLLKEKAIVDNSWIFENLDFHVLNEFVKLVCQELELFLSPIVEYFYTLLIAIHLSMTDNPCAVESIDDEKFRFLLDDHAFDKPLNLLETYLGRSLTANETAMLISSIELFPVKYLSDAAMQRRMIHSSLTDHAIYQLALETCDVFYPKNQSLRMTINFIDVYSPLQLIGSYYEFSYEQNSYGLNREFRRIAGPDFNNKIKELKERIKTKDYSQYYFDNEDQLNQKLYIIYKTFPQENQIQPVVVTFLSEKGFAKEQYYYHQLSSLFVDERLEYLSAQEVLQNNLWSELDLIVTDFTLARFDYTGQIFYINELVTQENFKKLEAVIEELEQAKQKNKMDN